MTQPTTMIEYKTKIDLPFEQVLNLYNNVGWTIYTSKPEQLQQALHNSQYLLTAWQGNTLVGLVRVITDHNTIAYVQDILVLKSFQRQGIGKELLKRVLDKFAAIRQVVLMTDDTEKTRAFYKSLNFRACDDGQLLGFMKINA